MNKVILLSIFLTLGFLSPTTSCIAQYPTKSQIRNGKSTTRKLDRILKKVKRDKVGKRSIQVLQKRLGSYTLNHSICLFARCGPADIKHQEVTKKALGRLIGMMEPVEQHLEKNLTERLKRFQEISKRLEQTLREHYFIEGSNSLSSAKNNREAAIAYSYLEKAKRYGSKEPILDDLLLETMSLSTSFWLSFVAKTAP